MAFDLVLVLSFLTELSSLLGPSGFWRLALPVWVCSLEYNNNNNAYVARVIEMLQENTVDLFHYKTCYKPQSKVLDKSTPYKDHVIGLKCGSSQTNFNSEILQYISQRRILTSFFFLFSIKPNVNHYANDLVQVMLFSLNFKIACFVMNSKSSAAMFDVVEKNSFLEIL